MIRLSAIDTHAPGETAALAQHLDRLGYHRFWATEHYSAAQSASPTVMAAHAASFTSRIRTGSGGVMLRYANVMRVAADFQLLAALFRDRIDLGVIGNRVADQSLEARLLDGRSQPDSFEHQLRALASLLSEYGGSPSTRAVRSILGAVPPQLWVCGLSTMSGSLAGELGAGFAYSPYMAGHLPGGATIDSVQAYRDRFRPSPGFQQPQTIISCYGACAKSESTAKQMWNSLSPAVPSFLGTPSQCCEQLQSLAASYGTSEVMIQCFGWPSELRFESYQLLADALKLPCQSTA